MNSTTSNFSEIPKQDPTLQCEKLILWELDARSRPIDMHRVLSSLKLLEQNEGWVCRNPEKVKRFFERLEVSVIPPKFPFSEQVLNLYQWLLSKYPQLFPHEEGDTRWATLKAEGNENVELEIPKNLLGMQSAYYHKLFTIGMSESQGHQVIAEDVSVEELKAFVHFLNTGQLELEGDNVVDLLKLAIKNLLPKLTSKCCEFIAKHLTQEELKEFLDLAASLDSPDLKWVCYEFLSKQCIPKTSTEALSEEDRLANLFSIYSIKFDTSQGCRKLYVGSLKESVDDEAFAVLKKLGIHQDTQELICSLSASEELKWHTFLENLQGSENHDLYFSRFEEVLEYVKNFRSSADPPHVKRPYLRWLNLKGLEFNDEKFQELAPYLSGLQVLDVSSSLITRLPPLPQNRVLVCEGCKLLKKVDLSTCLFFKASGCTQLEKVKLPIATTVDLNRNHAIRSLDLPSALDVSVKSCFNLLRIYVPQARHVTLKKTSVKTLEVPEAERLNCPLNQQLQEIKAPKALEVVAYGSMNLRKLRAPQAYEVDCQRCDQLTQLALEKVRKLNSRECPKLTVLVIPEAVNVEIPYCPSLREVELLKAKFLDCSHCDSLLAITLDEAKTIYADWCIALEFIYAPNASNLMLEGCLQKIRAQIPDTCTIGPETLNQKNISRI